MSPNSGVNEETAAQALENGNYKQAFDQYAELGKRGSLTAQLRLGWMYETGNGVDRSPFEAEQQYLSAAASGSPYTEFCLGNFYRSEERYADAVVWLEKSALAGYAPAMHALGVLYRFGAGVPRDLDRARTYFEQGARMGHVFAMKEVANDMIRRRSIKDKVAGVVLLAKAVLAVVRIGRKDPDSDLLIH